MSLDVQPQHMIALHNANRIRLARAEIKREIADGTRTVEDILADTPSEMESMTVMDLLMCQHKWGRTRARRFLASIPLSEVKPLGSLTPRQREYITVKLAGGIVLNPYTRTYL